MTDDVKLPREIAQELLALAEGNNCPALAEVIEAALAAEPVAWPILDKPAKVGSGRFHVGVSSRLVVEAAQRHYEYEVTPEKEAKRISAAQGNVESWPCFGEPGALEQGEPT